MSEQVCKLLTPKACEASSVQPGGALVDDGVRDGPGVCRAGALGGHGGLAAAGRALVLVCPPVGTAHQRAAGRAVAVIRSCSADVPG